jgi:Fuc2NAc and GlcNAc transferase
VGRDDTAIVPAAAPGSVTLTLVIVVLLVSSVASVGLTRMVRSYARAHAVLDVPNDRSLHAEPTPRGGGLAIAATFLVGATVLSISGLVSGDVVVALLGGGAMVVVVGWIDDRRGLPAFARVAAHAAAAAWALMWLGGVDRLQLGDHVLNLGAAGSLGAVVGIVWWINLYNFMDGIDGIAGGHALTVGIGAAVLMTAMHGSAFAILPVLLAGAAAGFLVLNWEPASVFMGDAGSGFLGFAFAVLAVASERAGALPIAYWVLLSGVFVFDSTVTLLRRVLRGESWYTAHRRHAYQRLVSLGYPHASVAGGVVLINVLICVLLLLVIRGFVPFALAAVIEIIALTVCYVLVERASPMYPQSSTESGSGAERV